MPCIDIREFDGITSLIALDSCGYPSVGSSSGLLSLSRVAEMGWEEQIEDGDQVTEKNFGGRKYYSDAGCDELTHIGVNLTSGGLNPALDSALMGSALKLASSAIRGYGRRDLNCALNVAIEVLIQLDAAACDGDISAAPVVGFLFPLVKNWRPSGATTLNGTDLLKPGYSGKGYKNPGLMEGPDGIPAQLTKWEGIFAPDEWYTNYMFDGAAVTLPTANCDPVPLLAAAS